MGLLVLSDVTEAATSAEVAAGRLGDDKIQRLAAHVRTHGFALLAGAIPTSTLELLAPRFEFDAAYRYLDALQADSGDSTPFFGGSKIPGHGWLPGRLPGRLPYPQSAKCWPLQSC